jgi:hypothetical protein
MNMDKTAKGEMQQQALPFAFIHGEAQQFKNASIIVVGDKNEPLNQWKSNISKDINWSI